MRGRLILAGLVAFAAFFVARAPAGLVLKPLVDQGRVTADGIGGSLYHGNASRLRLGGIELHDVDWRLNVLSLLLARLSVNLRFGLSGGGGETALSCGLSGSCEASGLRAVVPLATLAARSPQAAALDPSGQLDLDLSELSLDRNGITGLTGTVALRDLRLGPPVDLELGTLEASLSRDGENFVGLLADRGGPLELGGSLTLTPTGGYTLDARLKPRKEASPKLRQALQGLGRPDPQGRYTLKYSGQFGGG